MSQKHQESKKPLEKLSRSKHSHKGENGKVLIIGGSKDYTGAPALAAQAALRTGCDLTKILTSHKAKNTISTYSENLIVSSYSTDYIEEKSIKKAQKMAKWSDAVIIGPGTSQPEPEALRKIIGKIQKPKIIDAEAIKPGIKAETSDAIFTPHKKEAETIRNEYGSMNNFVQSKNNVVVLEKGETDKVYFKDDRTEISRGHPGMTVGGTGDVLTGIAAALIAQNISLKEAAIKAAEINGRSGEKAAKKYGNGLNATDLLEEIPKVLFKD
jgi:NAD(P)H-hydrate epimerase